MHEFLRQYRDQPERAQAFVAQSYKAACEAARSASDWSLHWLLLGITDPDLEGTVGFTSPQEKVAVAALQKEKRLLAEASRSASSSATPSNKNKKDDDA